jgi:predicted Ser/Thr protein kinase
MLGEIIELKDKNFKVDRLLGKGKSGYSYLITNDEEKFVLKKIHHEPCPYYDFDQDKLKSELKAYKILNKLIEVPELISVNAQDDYLIKEYIEGPTAAELIAEDNLDESYVLEIFEIFKLLKGHNINIDYFPTNFVIDDHKLIYVDYEFNDYQEKWDLINWGIYYWANHKGMKEYIISGSVEKINIDSDSGIPVKKGFEKRVMDWINKANIKT